MMLLDLITVLSGGMLGAAIVWHFVALRQRRPDVSLRMALPPDCHVVGVTIMHEPTGQVQFINVEDPVQAAERLTRRAA